MKRYLILFLLTLSTGLAAFAQANLQPLAIFSLTRREVIGVGQLRTELELRTFQMMRSQIEAEAMQTQNPNLMMRVPTPAEVSRAVQNLTVEQRRQGLDGMIDERLFIQAAERDGITFTDSEINQHMQQLRSQLAQNAGRMPTEDEFAQAIRNQTGQDLPAFRESIRRQAMAQKYLDSKKGEQLRAIRPPTEAEILSEFNLLRAEFVRPETIRFSMIQVPFGPDAASRTRAQDLANRLSREIGTDPSKFDEVVLRSHAPNSGYQAGDMGFLPRNREAMQLTGAEFINTAFALRQGEVSSLITGVQGFQIIKITETYSHRALELDDVIQPGTRVTVRQFIGQGLLEQRQREGLARATEELIRELRAQSTIEIRENNLNW